MSSQGGNSSREDPAVTEIGLAQKAFKRGIWGEIETRFSVHLLPVGYLLRPVSGLVPASPSPSDPLLAGVGSATGGTGEPEKPA